jgi:hypothetical protein
MKYRQKSTCIAICVNMFDVRKHDRLLINFPLSYWLFEKLLDEILVEFSATVVHCRVPNEFLDLTYLHF